MAYLLSPVCNESQIDDNGDPLSGGTISTYLAGTSTPAPTYTDISGATPQTNPIVLNTLGLAPSTIWLDSGLIYKFIVKNSVGVVQRTLDNISGVSGSIPTQDQWVVYGGSPTFIDATHFSVAGDQTSIFQVARRVRTTNTAGVVYGTVSAAVFGVVTTVTVVNDSGVLDAGLSQVAYGLLSTIDPSFTPIPKGSKMLFYNAAAPLGWTQDVSLVGGFAIRLVNGAGGVNAGTVNFTTAFSGLVAGSNSATTLTTAQIPAHSHQIQTNAIGNVGSNRHVVEPAGGSIDNTENNTGGGGSHNHTFTSTTNLAVKYADMILATKN